MVWKASKIKYMDYEVLKVWGNKNGSTWTMSQCHPKNLLTDITLACWEKAPPFSPM